VDHLPNVLLLVSTTVLAAAAACNISICLEKLLNGIPQTRNVFSRTPTDWFSFRRSVWFQGVRFLGYDFFLHTRFYFAMNGWVVLRRARITLLCEYHLLDFSYLIKPPLP
jgi:hypothetical protein